MKAVFITGTDTEVGKTRISVALMAWLQQHGIRVAGMKPIASGCEQTGQGLQNDDALALMRQASVDLAYELVNPYAFEPPIAPHIAATQAGKVIELDKIDRNLAAISAEVDTVIVEGAGGWLVPLSEHLSMAELATELALPVVLVVGIRLGCINHALLTVESILARGCRLLGWVANHVEENAQSAAIISSLQQRIDAPCLGVVPHLTDDQSASAFLTAELLLID